MNHPFEILFYLDSAAVSLLEVAIPKTHGYNAFPEISWFVLDKANENISQVRFASPFSRLKKGAKNVQKGFLTVSQSSSCHIISIDGKNFKFVEQPVAKLPFRDVMLLETYFGKAFEI